MTRLVESFYEGSSFLARIVGVIGAIGVAIMIARVARADELNLAVTQQLVCPKGMTRLPDMNQQRLIDTFVNGERLGFFRPSDDGYNLDQNGILISLTAHGKRPFVLGELDLSKVRCETVGQKLIEVPLNLSGALRFNLERIRRSTCRQSQGSFYRTEEYRLRLGDTSRHFDLFTAVNRHYPTWTLCAQSR